MSTCTVFVDRHGILSLRRFVHDLVSLQERFGYDIESDIDRLDRRPAIFTTLTEEVAAAVRRSRFSYSLLITPQEDFSGLDHELLRRAKDVVIAGKNPTVELAEDELRDFRLRDVSILSEINLEIDFAPTTDNESPNDNHAVMHLVFPDSYLDMWEYFVSARTIPPSIRILTDAQNLVPIWFQNRIADLGSEVEIVISTDTDPIPEDFFESAGVYCRNNLKLDAIDIKLRSVGQTFLNLQVGGDRTSELKSAQVSDWSSIVARLQRNLLDQDMMGNNSFTSKGQLKKEALPPPQLNVVCYKPTYLFADLVSRFERLGAVHSDFPLSSADGYIWMRPQEYAAFEDLVQGTVPEDVKSSYVDDFESSDVEFHREDLGDIAQHSVAIHHGTCFLPIVQFNAARLAMRLSSINRVAGVCELEQCYGPSLNRANSYNFEFVPIGYDDKLFNEKKIRRTTRKAETTLHIGFVGRAYGTKSSSLLQKSPFAHPKGYRKGGDHLVNVLLRLKARDLNFKLHVVGNNWDEVIEQCNDYGMSVEYHERDKTIRYEEYPSLLSSLDVLLICARAEGGPVAAIEAMSVGVPVVGSDTGLIPYLSKISPFCKSFHYDTKWHTMDYEAAERYLTELYQQDFSYKDRQKTRKRIERFSTDSFVRRVMSLATSRPLLDQF